jgi:hypothetical protein
MGAIDKASVHVVTVDTVVKVQVPGWTLLSLGITGVQQEYHFP